MIPLLFRAEYCDDIRSYAALETSNCPQLSRSIKERHFICFQFDILSLWLFLSLSAPQLWKSFKIHISTSSDWISSASPQLPHATVSCVECVSSALLFEQLLLSFFGAEAASLLPRSPSLSDFVRIFRQQCSESPAKQTRYIVSVMPIYTADKDHACHIRL